MFSILILCYRQQSDFLCCFGSSGYVKKTFIEWKIIVLADPVDLCAFTICNIGMDTWQYYETKRERIMYRDMFLIINVLLALSKSPN